MINAEIRLIIVFVAKSGEALSVQFSHSVVSNSLRPHELQHTRPPCPSPTAGVYPNPCPLSWWCHPTISSSVILFSSCPQSFPASGSFQMNQLSTSGGQSIGVSAWTSVHPMNTQDWSPLGWTGWISLQSNGPSKVFSNTKVQNSSVLSFVYRPTLTSIHRKEPRFALLNSIASPTTLSQDEKKTDVTPGMQNCSVYHCFKRWRCLTLRENW